MLFQSHYASFLHKTSLLSLTLTSNKTKFSWHFHMSTNMKGNAPDLVPSYPPPFCLSAPNVQQLSSFFLILMCFHMKSLLTVCPGLRHPRTLLRTLTSIPSYQKITASSSFRALLFPCAGREVLMQAPALHHSTPGQMYPAPGQQLSVE